MKRLILICLLMTSVAYAGFSDFGFQSFSLIGGGVCKPAIPVLAVSPSSKAFGNVSTNTTRSQWFTVSNTGKGTITGIQARMSSAGVFRVYSSSGTSAPMQFKTAFTPTAATAYSNVAYVDSGQFSTVRVPVSGAGVSGIPPECDGLLICQNYEGTGFDNSESWIKQSGDGVFDEDYSTAPLRSLQSLRIKATTASSSKNITALGFSAASEVYGHAIIKFVSTGSDQSIVMGLKSSTTAVARIEYRTNGTLSGYNGGATGVNSAGSRTGTTKHIWWHYKAASVSGDTIGTFQVYESADGNKPASPIITVGSVAGTSTLSVDVLNISATYGSEVIFDQVHLSTTDFATVPL